MSARGLRRQRPGGAAAPDGFLQVNTVGESDGDRGHERVTGPDRVDGLHLVGGETAGDTIIGPAGSPRTEGHHEPARRCGVGLGECRRFLLVDNDDIALVGQGQDGGRNGVSEWRGVEHDELRAR